MECRIKNGVFNVHIVDISADIGELELGGDLQHYAIIRDVYSAIKAIKGVVSFRVVNRYRFTIEKGTLFSEEDIIPKVLVILRDKFAPGEDINEVL